MYFETPVSRVTRLQVLLRGSDVQIGRTGSRSARGRRSPAHTASRRAVARPASAHGGHRAAKLVNGSGMRRHRYREQRDHYQYSGSNHAVQGAPPVFLVLRRDYHSWFSDLVQYTPSRQFFHPMRISILLYRLQFPDRNGGRTSPPKTLLVLLRKAH